MFSHLLYFLLSVHAFLYTEADDIHIRLLVTNDVHGAVFAHDFMKDEAHPGSLSRVKTFLDIERAKLNQHVILMDNGDMLQGQPTAYYANFVSPDDSSLFSRVMNYMAFDAASVGNHDIEAGPEVYNQIAMEFNFPYLAANAVDAISGHPHFQPYAIVERQGVRIAVLGLVSPGIPNWLPTKLWEGLEFTDLYETASYWVDYIKANEQTDAIIGLFHSGAGNDTDMESYELLAENAARHIAKFVPGIDVVFTAHDHIQRKELVVNSAGQEVLMICGQAHAQAVAAVDLVFSGGHTERRQLKSIEGQLIGMQEFDPCPTFDSLFQKEFIEVQQFINQPIGTLKTELNSRESFFGNAAFTDFVHQVQLSLTGADISFAAPLSFDVKISPGVLNMRDMFNLYRYENYLYVMDMKGFEIKDILEYTSSLWFDTMTDKYSNLLLFRKDEAGNIIINQDGKARLAHAFFNFDSADGLIYIVDVSKKAGERIQIKSLKNGEAFDLQKTYKVALNSYRGSNGGGHLVEGAGIPHESLQKRITFVSEKDLRSHMADYILEMKSIAPKPAATWTIIPESWAKEATKRDYLLLFGGGF
jgi:2',3'-cyclic-nucleotide 2'-phosphodiesterase / 3'-nucleotidase